MRSRAWAAIAFGTPIQLDAETACAMLATIRAAVVECSLPAEQAAELARRILAAVPGGPGLFEVRDA